MSGPGAIGRCAGARPERRLFYPVSVSREHPQLPLGLALRDSARYENYYAGNNGEVIAALRAVAHGSGDAPVFLAGHKGLGKSHLLQATCHEAAQSGLSSAYLPLQDLPLMSAEILLGLEHLQLVCVDDIDAIAGQDAWEMAVFDLFNRMHAAGNALLFAGQCRPTDCGFALADLVTRLGWGPVFTLRPLVESQLQAALQLRARARGLELPDDTAQFLLKRIPRDLPSVFDLFDRLDQAAMVEQRRLTIPFVKSVLNIE
ncbi:MAG: DnaA regulatory inactivator Hda [Gammaproteobacteria bacterium]